MFSHRMLLIDVPRHIERELTNLVKTMWGLSYREVKEDAGGSTMTSELQLEDSPWNMGSFFSPAGEKGVKLRQLLMEIIRTMRRCVECKTDIKFQS